MTYPETGADSPESGAKVAPVPERFSDLPPQLDEARDEEHENRRQHGVHCGMPGRAGGCALDWRPKTALV